MSEWSTRPLHRSLDALAQLAVRETSACGYAYVEKDLESGDLKQVSGEGSIANGSVSQASLEIVKYSLVSEVGDFASIAFAFRPEQDIESARIRLEAIVESIRALWQMEASKTYASLAKSIATRELELIDSKIVDRAKGILTSHPIADSSEAIVKHILNVTRTGLAQRALIDTLTNLEEELAERKLISQAKKILQFSQGISEEQAHTELRRVSRTSRKPLRDVALHIIGAKSRG